MKPTHLFSLIGLILAICGYPLLALGDNRGHYGVMGIFGTLFGVLAVAAAIKDAGMFKNVHHTPAE